MSDNPNQTTIERVLGIDRKQIDEIVARYMRGAAETERRNRAAAIQSEPVK